MTTRCLTFSRKAIGSKPPTTALDGSYWTPKCGESMRLDDLEKDVFRLRELRVAPGAVLVVVLHAQDDVALAGVFERRARCPRACGDAVVRATCRDAAGR